MLRFIICERYRPLRSKKHLKVSTNAICFRRILPFVRVYRRIQLFSQVSSLYLFSGIGSTTCSEINGLQEIGMPKCRDEEGN